MNALASYEPTPWRRPDVGIFAAGQVVGLGLVAVAWILASGEVRSHDQIPALNLGVAGAGIAIATGVRFLRRGRRVVAGRQAAVSDTLRRSAGPVFLPDEIDVRSGKGSDRGVALVSSDRMTRYHRTGCQLVAGKPTVPAGRPDHEAAGRQPCGVCRP